VSSGIGATQRVGFKDMAARTLLLKLERAGCIALPARQRPSANARRNLHIAPVLAPEEPISSPLRELQPLAVREN